MMPMYEDTGRTQGTRAAVVSGHCPGPGPNAPEVNPNEQVGMRAQHTGFRTSFRGISPISGRLFRACSGGHRHNRFC